VLGVERLDPCRHGVPQIADRLEAVRIRHGAGGDVAFDVVPQFRETVAAKTV
jgi:hypothetical protein